jgi:hypothetical protein
MAFFKWLMELKDGQTDEFYHEADDNETSPLERIKDFDKGDSWSVDGDFEGYPEDPDPDGDGFPLVPKLDVVKVWRESSRPPVKVQKRSMKDFLEGR